MDEATAARSDRGLVWAVGAMAGFATLWIYNTIQLCHAPVWWLAIPAGSAVGLLLAAIRASRTARAEPRMGRMRGRGFWLVFALEIGAILAVVSLLPGWGLGDYVVAAIAAIVGLHFLPLARLFQAPIYYVTAALLVLAAIAPLAVSDPPRRAALTCLAAGAVLFATCLYLVLRGRRLR